MFEKCMEDLKAAAIEGNAGLYFEASCVGGVPVIRALTESMQGNRIDSIIGIVNGTNAGPLLAQKLYDEGIITDVVVENTDTFTQYEGAYVTKTERYEDLDALLETGEIDAACMDACIAQTYMNDQREFLDVSIAHQEYGVATVKDSALSAPVAEAVQAMLDDGTIERLIDKWN